MVEARIAHGIAVAAARGGGQDRARVFEADGGVTVVVADGAGGTGNGALAAQAIVDAVGVAAAEEVVATVGVVASHAGMDDVRVVASHAVLDAAGAVASQAVADTVGAVRNAPRDWSALLFELDRDAKRLGHGQSTAVVISIRGGVLSGASAGDSGAWLVQNGDAIDLTEGQSRKPLVGAGCRPWHIPRQLLGDGTLLVASDGLLHYAPRAAIIRLVSGEDLPTAARALVDLVRLPSGGLQDDVAVVLCRQLRVRAASDDVQSAPEEDRDHRSPSRG